jgi:tetratricopeptide (TPR) repeat protein
MIEKGQHVEGIADCNEAVRMEPKSPIVLNNRAFAWNRLAEFEKAIDDCNAALRLDPRLAAALKNRGLAWQGKREFDRATADFDEAIRYNPNLFTAFESRALLRACCVDDRYRDGKQALLDATKACELCSWKDADSLAALAAAYAELGDFSKATEWQQIAIDLAPERSKVEFQSRLELFQAGQPYRQ